MYVLILVGARKADYSTDPQDGPSCAPMENTSLAQSSETELEVTARPHTQQHLLVSRPHSS